MTDRDTFAAAALTGLLAGSEHNRDLDDSGHAELAYFIADAMLRERERRKEKDASFSYSTPSPPVASTGPINRQAASQSPDEQCGGGEPLDVPQDDNSRAAGGRGQF